MEQIDYKEKYEQALERARQFSEKPYLEDSAGIVEYIFPELKESEDERIRKALIKYFTLSDDNAYYQCCGVHYRDIVAWLEKQGEQKPTDKVELSAFKDKLLELFQKFRYIKEGVPTNGDIIDYVDSHIQELINTVQNKPWSEEDETTKNNISHIIRQYDKISKKENKPCWYIGDCLLWMQNIKGRVQPQPKHEWSGGDEAHLHSLITHLEQWIERHPNTTGADIQGENITWLKSLRPQNTWKTWKPSEEQIEALEYSLGDYNIKIFEDRYEILKSLYQDLKKLKEE